MAAPHAVHAPPIDQCLIYSGVGDPFTVDENVGFDGFCQPRATWMLFTIHKVYVSDNIHKVELWPREPILYRAGQYSNLLLGDVC